MSTKVRVVYVTSSPFKQEENRIFLTLGKMNDGTPISDLFEFSIKPVQIKETLEVKLEVMVREEVIKAYSELKVPCIVEHAGLIFDEYQKDSYPGGLTKPMWDTLGDRFLTETNSSKRRVLARAVIAYCDGMSVKTFLGETSGQLADAPRGERKFYWDTVFMPDDPNGRVLCKTYAEIVAEPSLGLAYKVEHLSQSSKAMRSFLEYIRDAPTSRLWR